MVDDSKKAFHLKHRPKDFEDFWGNSSMIASLKSVVYREEGMPHSFLFTGPSGCGKTTLARIICEILQCDEKDFLEYNMANTRGIDTIRDISYMSRYAATAGKIKIYLIDECHKLTNDAQNALLKLLEDTPRHVYFILCTTDPEKLINTIKTRCSTFRVRRLPTPQIITLLKSVCKKEKREDFNDEVLNRIAKASLGSPRKALVMLDQVFDIEDEDEALEIISEGMVDESQLIDLCRILSKPAKNKKEKWVEVGKIIAGLSGEPEQIRTGILNYMAKILFKRYDLFIAEVMGCFKDNYFYNGKAGLLHDCFLACHVED